MTENSYKRIVLKLGTNLLTSGRSQLDVDFMSVLVAQVAELHRNGHEILIVTSGAVAAGRQRLGIAKGTTRELKGIPLKQVLAAVGQGRLMTTYDALFEHHQLAVAQALLTRAVLIDRAGYLNARNTLLALFELGVIGIINENDVVAVEELEEARFGDNDNLSAMVANLVDADLLVLLTDIGGLYTADPHTHPEAQLITEISEITPDIEAMAAGPHAAGATGGMTTKIEAANLATSSGVRVVIASGHEADVIKRLVRGEAIGTHFLPAERRESRARWMLSGLRTRGRLSIDAGATRALTAQNRSLLAAGLRAVSGDFERGDIVDIEDNTNNKLGAGISNYSSAELRKIIGAHSDQIAAILGHDYNTEVIHRNNLTLI